MNLVISSFGHLVIAAPAEMTAFNDPINDQMTR
jgi:hypothetical protein